MPQLGGQGLNELALLIADGGDLFNGRAIAGGHSGIELNVGASADSDSVNQLWLGRKFQ